jgi:hypothetical protein
VVAAALTAFAMLGLVSDHYAPEDCRTWDDARQFIWYRDGQPVILTGTFCARWWPKEDR